jgi:glycosyltransferase involved in cell wall biosynthesis
VHRTAIPATPELHDGRIAVFLYGDDESGSGAQRRTLTLIESFAARGHAVDVVVVRAGGELRAALPSGVRLVELGAWSTRLPGARASWRARVYGSIPALARYLRREQPRVLLSAATHINLAAIWAWRLAGAGTRLVLRESNHPPPRRLVASLVRRSYPLASDIIAVSHGVAAAVAETTGLPSSRIKTIYNPVVTPRLTQLADSTCEEPWLKAGAPPVVLGVGRLRPQKDFPTLVRAFARVRRLHDARLLIVGNGDPGPLHALAAELGVGDDVRFPGFVQNPLPYMARAAVFVLSSAWEGLPGVLIEAMACGCPVVSTDCPSGPAEILEHGRLGPLVPVGDDAALARAIDGVLAARPDRARLQERARAFGIEATDRYLDVLLS